MQKSYSLFVLLLFPLSVWGAELKPFTTDGCSSFPDGKPKQESLWAECCIRHDLAYWKGGSYEERLAADLALERCVAQAGEPEIAKLMLAGVRVGGSPYFPTDYRWGYGWPFPRGYTVLSQEEKIEVKHRLEFMQHLLENLTAELENHEDTVKPDVR